MRRRTFPSRGGIRRRVFAGDRGAVTVEGAITLCSLIVVLGFVLSMVGVLLDQLRCADAAGEAARMLGRGDDARAQEAVRRLAPDGSTLTREEDDAGIDVTVHGPALGGLLPGIDLSADAYAVREPDGAESDGDPGPAARDESGHGDEVDRAPSADVPVPGETEDDGEGGGNRGEERAADHRT